MPIKVGDWSFPFLVWLVLSPLSLFGEAGGNHSPPPLPHSPFDTVEPIDLAEPDSPAMAKWKKAGVPSEVFERSRVQAIRLDDAWVYLPPTPKGVIFRVWLPKSAQEAPLSLGPGTEQDWLDSFERGSRAQKLLFLNAMARELARGLNNHGVSFLEAIHWTPESAYQAGGELRDKMETFQRFRNLGRILKRVGFSVGSPEVRAALHPLTEQLKSGGLQRSMATLLREGDRRMQAWVRFANHVNESSLSANLYQSVSDWWQHGNYGKAEKEIYQALQRGYAPLHQMVAKFGKKAYERNETGFLEDYSDFIDDMLNGALSLDEKRKQQNDYQAYSRDQIWAAEAIVLTLPLSLPLAVVTATAATAAGTSLSGASPGEAAKAATQAGVGRLFAGMGGHPALATKTWAGWLGVNVALPTTTVLGLELGAQWLERTFDGGIEGEDGKKSQALDGERLWEAGLTAAVLAPLIARFPWLGPPTLAMFGHSATGAAIDAYRKEQYGKAAGETIKLGLPVIVKLLTRPARGHSPTDVSQRASDLKTLGLNQKIFETLSPEDQRAAIRAALRVLAKKHRLTNGDLPQDFARINGAADNLLRAVPADPQVASSSPEPPKPKLLSAQPKSGDQPRQRELFALVPFNPNDKTPRGHQGIRALQRAAKQDPLLGENLENESFRSQLAPAIEEAHKVSLLRHKVAILEEAGTNEKQRRALIEGYYAGTPESLTEPQERAIADAKMKYTAYKESKKGESDRDWTPSDKQQAKLVDILTRDKLFTRNQAKAMLISIQPPRGPPGMFGNFAYEHIVGLDVVFDNTKTKQWKISGGMHTLFWFEKFMERNLQARKDFLLAKEALATESRETAAEEAFGWMNRVKSERLANGVTRLELPKDAFLEDAYKSTVKFAEEKRKTNDPDFKDYPEGGKTLFPSHWTDQYIMKVLKWGYRTHEAGLTKSGPESFIFDHYDVRIIVFCYNGRIVSALPTWNQP